MIEVLEDSLEDIPSSPSEQMALFNEIVAQDRADHKRFLDSSLPGHAGEWNVPESRADEVRGIFYKFRNVCHIALLPAEIRYKGILTESPPVNMFDLPDGLLSNNIRNIPNHSPTLRLVGDSETRQECEVPLNMDHQDFFYLGEEEGKKELVVPNDSEMREYRPDGAPFIGFIMTCFVGCPWDSCDEGNIIGGVDEKTVKMEVNGQPVTSLFKVKKECFLLQNGDDVFWKPDSASRFAIGVRVLEPHGYIRISSIMIW